MAITTGMIIPFSGSSVPSGYLLCDGSAVSRSTYSTLFGVIGTTYGSGDGSTTFNVPDLRGRVPAGKDNMGGSAASRLTGTTMSPDGNTLGASGGEQTHTLTIAELASHGHDVRGTNNGIYNTTVGLKDNNCINIQGDDNANGGTSGLVTNNSASNPYVGSTGSSSAHNNVQPSLILNYIIATQDDSGGSVTSVGLSTDASWLTVGSSPVTSSGTITINKTDGLTGNQVLATPNGSTGKVALRSLVGADLPNPSSSSLGGVQSLAAVSHKWINAISTSGVPSATQPDFSDLTGSANSSQVPTNLRLGSAGIVVDGGGATITTGQKGYLLCPYAGTITAATLIADQSGSCVIDVWKAAYPTIPTVTNSIVASAPPTLSSAQESQDSTLTGWTTSVSAGDVIGFNVNSASGITRVMLSLSITKS